MTDRRPAQPQLPASVLHPVTQAPPTRTSTSHHMPLAGAMVREFPEPGRLIRQAMERLQRASFDPPIDDDELHQLAHLPRPWDPATCAGQMRSELWAWLDLVAIWINEEHLWNVTRPGIPECWPAHPHVVHDLAVLACTRYYTKFTVTPAAIDDWHRYGLPSFLERLRDRLGDGCQPARHQTRPRLERDKGLASPEMRRQRLQRQADDVGTTSQSGERRPE